MATPPQLPLLVSRLLMQPRMLRLPLPLLMLFLTLLILFELRKKLGLSSSILSNQIRLSRPHLEGVTGGFEPTRRIASGPSGCTNSSNDPSLTRRGSFDLLHLDQAVALAVQSQYDRVGSRTGRGSNENGGSGRGLSISDCASLHI
jgi:hypothetical protein